MFTGIVQRRGIVTLVDPPKLSVDAGDWEIVTGESIAVNGCCLTAIGTEATFELSPETYQRTNLGSLKVGDSVNLERALLASERLGGHLVQGHVDGVATIIKIEELPDGFWSFEFQVGAELSNTLVDKGSVCLDGISLTVVKPSNGRFTVSVIPHTWAHTNLENRKVDETVNFEGDIIVKTLIKLSEPYV